MPEKLYYEDICMGDELPPLVEYPTTMQLVKYAAASNNYYQVHYDKDFAREAGLQDVLVQGCLGLAFLGKMISGWMGESGKLVRLGGQYREMMYVHEEIFCYGRVEGKRKERGHDLVDIRIWTENPDGRLPNPLLPAASRLPIAENGFAVLPVKPVP